MADTDLNGVKHTPQTIARIAPSIRIYYNNNQIGSIVSMKRDVRRRTYRRFELDSSVPGRAAEIIPGPIDTITLTIQRALLNTGSLLDVLGFTNAEDLAYQNYPIDIIERRYTQLSSANKTSFPAETFSTSQYDEIIYTGCYFTSNPLDIKVDGDWQILQDFTLEVTSVNKTQVR